MSGAGRTRRVGVMAVIVLAIAWAVAATGEPTSIVASPTGTLVNTSAISDAGLVVGVMNTDGGESSMAFDVNTAGVVVGYRNPAGSFAPQAVRYDLGQGNLTPIDPLPGDTTAIATGLNDADQIVGVSGPDVGFSGRGFVLDRGSGDRREIPASETVPKTGAFDINDAGIVVGGSISTSTPSTAFRYDPTADILTPIGTLPGDSNSVAVAINEHGVIVGHSCPSDQPGRYRAFAYDPETSIPTEPSGTG